MPMQFCKARLPALADTISAKLLHSMQKVSALHTILPYRHSSESSYLRALRILAQKGRGMVALSTTLTSATRGAATSIRFWTSGSLSFGLPASLAARSRASGVKGTMAKRTNAGAFMTEICSRLRTSRMAHLPASFTCHSSQVTYDWQLMCSSRLWYVCLTMCPRASYLW